VLCQEELGEDILKMSTDEIISRTKLLDNEIKVIEVDFLCLCYETVLSQWCIMEVLIVILK